MWIEDYKVEGSIVDGVNPDSLKREAEFTPPTSNPKPNKKKPQQQTETPNNSRNSQTTKQTNLQSSTTHSIFFFYNAFSGRFFIVKVS